MTKKAARSPNTVARPMVGEFFSSWLSAWDHFWFTPRSGETLALIRIACGAMLTYIHVIWLSLLSNFMGSHAWIDHSTIRELHRQDWAWSWLFYVESPGWLIMHQLVAIAASLCMMLGFLTRLAIPVTWWMTLMVCHRMTGALFGLDQVVMMLSMYLMWSRCGSLWSLDAWLTKRLIADEPAVLDKASQHFRLRQAAAPVSIIDRVRRLMWLPAGCCASNNITTRLIQLHLCVIYLFGGLSKMRGEMWWDGSAIWFSVVNYEYQSLDLTWLGHFPFLIGVMTAVTIFWETYYCALIWPKLTRPVALTIALCVHGGICVALGMWTFGTMMIVANLAFISPQRIKELVSRFL